MAEAAVMKALDGMLAQAAATFGRDVPELLSLSAQALQRAPFPRSWHEASRLDRNQLFQLLPIATAACTAVAIPLLLLNAGKNRRLVTKETVSRHSYWLTRVLLLRGMALCYLAGFLTAAFQVGDFLLLLQAGARGTESLPCACPSILCVLWPYRS